jgi:serine/threonine-protein kinase
MIRNKGLKIAAAVLASAVALAVVFYYAWESGHIHKNFLKPWYTPVTLSMSLPSSAANDSDLPMRAFFFVDNDKDIPEVQDTRRIFIPDTRKYAQNTTSTQRYRTKPVYLKPGSYRIKVVSGPYVWWQSVLVTEHETHIPLDFLKNSRRPVAFNVKTIDALQKTDLTNNSSISIKINNSWVPISQIKPGVLTSGGIFQVRVSAPGYVTENFSLRVEWYQDEIYITAGLKQQK